MLTILINTILLIAAGIIGYLWFTSLTDYYEVRDEYRRKTQLLLQWRRRMRLYSLPDTTIIDLKEIESITRIYQDVEEQDQYDICLKSRAFFTIKESILARETFIKHLTDGVPQR